MRVTGYTLVAVVVAVAVWVVADTQGVGGIGLRSDADLMPYPQMAQGGVAATRGTDKLASELRVIQRQFSPARGRSSAERTYSPDELRRRFGISGTEANPVVELVVTADAGADLATLEQAGATIHLRVGDLALATAPVLSLGRIAQAAAVNDDVVRIDIGTPQSIPPRPSSLQAPALELPGRARGPATALANEFDHQRLTGKGVIVAVVDTGIDWKHPDFIRPDGTSRILLLWDMEDGSWTDTDGKVGSQPPYYWKDDDGNTHHWGTFYTNEQINAALRGAGTVNSIDTVGHGTACAGTAAGNGRATDQGVPAGTHMGVAPEADLIVVKTDFTNQGTTLATNWVAERAAAFGRPCVVSMSFGSQDQPHDGSRVDEQLLDSKVGPGKPGLAVCVSAGNDRLDSFHAGGRFGPRREGQLSIQSPPIELFMSDGSDLVAFLDGSDRWGMYVKGLDDFLVDKNGNPLVVWFERLEGDQWTRFVTLDGEAYTGPIMTEAARKEWVAEEKALAAIVEQLLGKKPPAFEPPKDFNEYRASYASLALLGGNTEKLSVYLRPGRYKVAGYGTTDQVPNGRFDLYLPLTDLGSFGKGAEARYTVGSPGNAEQVITVGSYDFRGEWENLDGQVTRHNLVLGELSDYSCAGYRRDGVVKPDLVAPARYTISPVAKVGDAYAEMGLAADGATDTLHITRDGWHVAWAGTSASTPYVAGVVALMFEKNPNLDAAQIKDILRRTAVQDGFTGGTPNPEWGYGKVDPAAALKATP